MKKFLALALALTLGISLAATAFAEGLNLLGEAASLPEEAAAPAQARLEEAPAPEALPAADSFEEHKGAAGWTDVSSAQEWSAALDGIGTAGSTICQIRLTGSFALPDMLTIAQGNTLELDLNGQTLTAAQGKRHLAVSGSLTLTDSGSGGVLYGGDPAGNPGGGIEVWQDGTFTMKGGAITGCAAPNNNGGGVSVWRGSFIMEGGAITGCTAGYNGGGVNVGGGSFTMKGGAITGCTARYNGGGVVTYADDGHSPTFLMEGGAITDCTAQSSGGVDAKGTFAMKGEAAITGCTAEYIGGGVTMAGTSFSMEGNAAITGCTAETGGGVYMNIGAFSMADSAAITGCAATEEAGGVWISGARSDSITVSGAPRVAGNKAGTNKADSNLCLYSEAGVPGSSSDKFPQVTVRGTLGQGASLGLTLDGAATWGGQMIIKTDLGGEAGAADLQKFFPDSDPDNSLTSGTLTPGGDLPTAAAQVESVVLDKTALNLTAGQTETLTAIVYPLHAADRTVTWKSGNEAIATVNADGRVTAVAGGTVTITATAGKKGQEKQAACTVTVTGEAPTPPAAIVPDTGVALDKAALGLAPGQTARLKATLTPADATYKYIFWTSSDEGVATVSDSGLVTAVAEGAAIITAKSWYGNTATCAVTVKTPDEPTPPEPTDPWPTEGLAGFVTRCYRVALGRDPDKAGHADWVRWLQDGTVDATTCTSGFVFSKEMNNKNLSDEAFVRTLYELFMGREGEAAGVAFWADYLNGGHSREEVFHGFADSAEFDRIKANYGIR